MNNLQLLWNILKKYDLDINDVKEILFHLPQLRPDVADYLLVKDSSEQVLREILEHNYKQSGEILNKVAEKLLAGDPANDVLVEIVLNAPDESSDQAWQVLLKKNPTAEQLYTVAHEIKELAEEAWENILDSGSATNDDLCTIMAEVEELRERAWNLFKERSPSKTELHWLIRNVEPIAGKARSLLDEIRNSEKQN